MVPIGSSGEFSGMTSSSASSCSESESESEDESESESESELSFVVDSVTDAADAAEAAACCRIKSKGSKGCSVEICSDSSSCLASVSELLPVTDIMNSVLESVLHDVLPTVHTLPANLKTETSNLYNRSRSIIPLRPNEESARYHICAILAVNKFKNELNVLGPSIDRVPLPPKTTRAFINMFNQQLNRGVRSTNSSPSKNRSPTKSLTGSPTKGRSPITNIHDMRDLLKTPRKRGRPPKNPLSQSQSPHKIKSPFMQRLEHASGSLIMNDITSPNLSSSPSKSASGTSPLRKGEIYRDPEPGDTNNPFLDSQAHEISIFDSSTLTKSQFKTLNSQEIITLCNKFQLPHHIVPHILSTFQKYHSTASNEWMILCGLILNCYFIIHHQGIKLHLGSKSKIIKTMFDLQNGGLLLSEMKKGISLVYGLIEFAGWFKKLSVEYGCTGDKQLQRNRINEESFITQSWKFVEEGNSGKRDFEEWLSAMKLEITENLGENNRE
ncbi:hypothetical protein WICPIJ_006873 [Wickerhamomyces pijperi]|uniref:ORC6 first cyclin-like domain-containing protein n=1 Tax=Wickerhamomyces pijperi TaxID=599730 RepID=A0A9P8TL00_WICPI|nr:hypothetical protein WICPIJ_006873 [Wickerhamomyces pijperi]